MYSFSWDSLVSDDLLGVIRADAGIDQAMDMQSLRPLIGRILSAIGGPPLVEEPLSPEQQLAWAIHILNEAVRHVLHRACARGRNKGFVVGPSSSALFAGQGVAVRRLPINRASAHELEALPGVGPAIAARIVATRISSGPFRSLDELDRRIAGMGEQLTKSLADAIRFDEVSELATERLSFAPSLSHNLASLLSVQPGASTIEQLRHGIEAVAIVCARDKHPYGDAGMQHPSAPVAEEPAAVADVRVLWGSDYYTALVPLFQAAGESIDVCMFHIAMAGEDHPTRTLLDGLIAAAARGVAVRVLLDADRDTDPYLSSVINREARLLLQAAGIQVRSDAAEKLLHSKFIVIDRSLVVLGSHNWSAGSYFRFDDLSVVISSAEIATAQSARFDGLWG